MTKKLPAPFRRASIDLSGGREWVSIPISDARLGDIVQYKGKVVEILAGYNAVMVTFISGDVETLPNASSILVYRRADRLGVSE